MSDPWRTWMPLDIGRYLKDTSRLTTLEHGAYLLLIMDYWNAGSLPQDDASLCSIARLQPKQWAAMRPKIAAFFRPDWTHKKVEKELAEAEAKYHRRANAGSAGGEATKRRRTNARSNDVGERGSIAGSNECVVATHNKQVTSSNDEAWVSVRERVTAAFASAGSPNAPDTSHVEVWKSRGHDPAICVAVVTEIVTRKPSISRLTYFDQPIADRHVTPIGQARAGPGSSSAEGRHDVLAELRAKRDGQRNHDDEAGRQAGEANGPVFPRLERVPQPG